MRMRPPLLILPGRMRTDSDCSNVTMPAGCPVTRLLRSWLVLPSLIKLRTAGRPHHFVGGDHAAVDARHQSLADDAGERGELHPYLRLPLGRELVDDPRRSTGRVVGVQRGEHEVTGLGDRQRDPDGLEVAHLTDEHHVGVLAQRRAQRSLNGVRVAAHLALVDDAHL